MVNQSIFTIKSNRQIASDIFKMELNGDVSQISSPGQFVNIRIDNYYLRRPVSVCDKICGNGSSSDGILVIVYKVIGGGTARLSEYSPGETLDVLSGLGNGYDVSASGDDPLLLGGGVGVPPLYWLCKELVAAGKRPHVVLGFNSAKDAILSDEFSSLCPGAVTVTTADGSLGNKGFVTDHLPSKYSFFYACGPLPMLKAVHRISTSSGEFSLEERMGCGFGACMGCSIQLVSGSKRVCKDGPVFRKEELPW